MGQVASPNLTFTVTAPGGSPVDYTSKLTWMGGNQSMQITQNFGRQGDTSTFVLTDDWGGESQPNFYIPVLSKVKLTDNGISKVLFAGLATDVVQDVQSTTYNEWDLNCTDYTFYADNSLVQGTFIGYTVDQIVISLTTQANCGITAAKVVNGGFVAPGPQLASFVMQYGTLSDAWRQLATLAGQVTPYGWYVDENQALHFYDASTAVSSGSTFTMLPTAQHGSTTEGHWYYGSSFGYEWDGTSVHNKILVQGADQTFPHGTVPSSTPTDTFLGNGYQTSWALKYIVTGTPVLHVNGASTTVTVVSAGQTGSGTWQIVQNAIGTWFLTVVGASPPSAGTVLKVWYDYSVPIVAQAQDAASQSTYGLVLAEYINDTSLTTVPMALARAMRERQEYAFAVERATFTTTEDWQGWVRAGETFKYVNNFIRDDQGSQWGVNDTFICVSNSISFGEGGYRQAMVTGVRI